MTSAESLAIKLREAAFPGAVLWEAAGSDTRDRWVNAAVIAEAHAARILDQKLREAVTKAHEIGQHAAAKMLREMRR